MIAYTNLSPMRICFDYELNEEWNLFHDGPRPYPVLAAKRFPVCGLCGRRLFTILDNDLFIIGRCLRTGCYGHTWLISQAPFETVVYLSADDELVGFLDMFAAQAGSLL